jgi:hypothetical protein
MQYENALQTHDKLAYYDQFVQRNMAFPRPFGNHFMSDHALEKPSYWLNPDTIIAEAGMRLCNNTIYQWIQDLGGLDNFYGMSHGAFVHQLAVVERLLDSNPGQLRRSVDHCMFDAPTLVLPRLEHLMHDCWGVGHEEMLGALSGSIDRQR